MKKFSESLRKHTIKTINFKKKKMKLLTNEQQELYGNSEILYFCKEKFAKNFHKGSNYGHHFIIKELEEWFEGQFTCLGENTEKYITFSVPTEKEVIRISKNGEDVTNTLSYRLNFNDNVRFMTSWLSHLVYNLDERIY